MTHLPCTGAIRVNDSSSVSQNTSDGWLEQFRYGLDPLSPALLVDSFFADRGMNSGEHAYGRLTVAPQWSGYHKFEVDSRFRARFQLPHAKKISRLYTKSTRVSF